MTRVRTYPCVALLLLCGAPEGLIAGVFTLSIEGPERIAVDPGLRRTETFHTVLAHEGEGPGANAWSYGLESRNCEIVSATTEGTDAIQHFVVLQIIDPSRNGGRTGFVSATVLHVAEEPELPSRASLAKLWVEFPFTDQDGTASLLFAEGLRGGGQPVPIRVTQGGDSFQPGWIDRTVDLQPPDFSRGDASLDGQLDIGDPIGILEALFRGGRQPACEDAADANDDGGLDISDAVHLLAYLFLGSDPPPAPHPECGPDSTADDLPCHEESSCAP